MVPSFPAQAAQSPAAFWEFADGYQAREPPAGVSCFQEALDAATPLIGSEEGRKLLAVSLAARVYSPLCEAFAAAVPGGLAARPCCWVQLPGGVEVRDVGQLDHGLVLAAQALEGSAGDEQSPQFQGFDHVYGGTLEGGAPVPHAVLYAPLGSACGRTFRGALAAAAEAGEVGA